jgi:hypothetical protein
MDELLNQQRRPNILNEIINEQQIAHSKKLPHSSSTIRNDKDVNVGSSLNKKADPNCELKESDGRKNDINESSNMFKQPQSGHRTSEIVQNSSSSRSAAASNHQSQKFASVNSAFLTKTAHNMLAAINKKRANDEQLHAEFKTCMTEWASQLTTKCIESSYAKSAQNSMLITEKIQMISEELDKIEAMEKELKVISQHVELLYKEILNESPN